MLGRLLLDYFIKDVLTIDPYTNGYAIGSYTLYSSTTWSSSPTKKFFSYITNDGDARFAVSGTCNTPNGNYGGIHYIVSGYTGDWIIVKLPYQIIFSKFIFYARPSLISRSPGLWRCYGSYDH